MMRLKGFRVSDEALHQLEEFSRLENRTLSSSIRHILKRFFDKNDRKQQ